MSFLETALGLLAAAAAAALGVSDRERRPPEPPPGLGGLAQPGVDIPPAWVAIGERRAWLSYGSYCWTHGQTGVCVDAALPGKPVLHASPGRRVRFHLGFEPRFVHLSAPGFQRRMPAKRSFSWTVPREAAGRRGTLSMLVRARFGDVSYGGRLVIR